MSAKKPKAKTPALIAVPITKTNQLKMLNNIKNEKSLGAANKNNWNNLVNLRKQTLENTFNRAATRLKIKLTAKTRQNYILNITKNLRNKQIANAKAAGKKFLIKSPWQIIKNTGTVLSPNWILNPGIIVPGNRKNWTISWNTNGPKFPSVKEISNEYTYQSGTGQFFPTNGSCKGKAICNKLNTASAIYKKGSSGLSVLELSLLFIKHLKKQPDLGKRKKLQRLILEFKRNGDYVQIFLCNQINTSDTLKIIKPGNDEVALFLKLGYEGKLLTFKFPQPPSITGLPNKIKEYITSISSKVKISFQKCIFWSVDIPAIFFAILMGGWVCLQNVGKVYFIAKVDDFSNYYFKIYNGPKPLFLETILQARYTGGGNTTFATIKNQPWFRYMCAFDSAHDFIKPGDRSRALAADIYSIISSIDNTFAEMLLLSTSRTLVPSKQTQNEAAVRDLIISYITSKVTLTSDNAMIFPHSTGASAPALFVKFLNDNDACINRDAGSLLQNLYAYEANLSAKVIDPGT